MSRPILCKCGCGEATSSRSKWKIGHRYPNKARPIHERFMDKVDVGLADDCWTWTAARDKNGYGVFAYSKYDIGFAHRYSFEYHYNKSVRLPPEIKVCHSCDNRECVNPKHLFIGSQQDNVRDMIQKGRGAKGVMYPQATLNEELVDQILLLRRSGLTAKDIAVTINRSYGSVYHVLRGSSWSWYTGIERQRNATIR